MQAYLTLTRRDLGAYFLSLTGYLVLAAATFLLGLSFVDLLEGLRKEPERSPVTELFFNKGYFRSILLLTTPAITMRLFALEKFSGTFETLMTAPVSDLQVVLAKFTAGLVFYLVMWLPLLGCIYLVRYYSNDPAALDVGAVGGTFLGITLLGGLFISLGCCASALTRSQTAAAVLTLAFALALVLPSVLADLIQTQTAWQAKVLACLALPLQAQDFTRGVVDTRPVVLLLTLTFFFLFLTLRVVESRRWK